MRLDDAGQVRGGKAEAGNLYRLLRHMFRKALAWKLRPKEAGNPLENTTEPRVERRERLQYCLGQIHAEHEQCWRNRP